VLVVVVVGDMPEDGFTPMVMPKVWNRFANMGVIFENGYAVDPWCGPSRATLFTGEWVHNHNLVRGSIAAVNDVWYADNLEADTIATRAKDVGIRTAMVGKYLNGAEPARVPAGWDRFFSFPPVGGNDTEYTVHVDGRPTRVKTSEWNDTALVFDYASKFVQKNADSPWMLYVATNAPHAPASSSEENDHDFDGEPLPEGLAYDRNDLPEDPGFMRAAYEAMLEECRDIDDGFARLLGKLAATGQLDNTIVIFTSDNGYLYGEHGVWKKTLPWEESVGVPFAAFGPGLPVAACSKILVGHVDVPFTAMAALGADTSGMDGMDMRRSGQADWRSELLVEYPHTGWALLTDGSWTYFEYPGGAKHLYDMETDPHQTNNRAGEGLPQEATLDARLDQLKEA
jgi:arylsulfatase A-like enzyme